MEHVIDEKCKAETVVGEIKHTCTGDHATIGWHCISVQAGCVMAVIHCEGHYFLISPSSRFLSLLPEETLALKRKV